MAGQRAWKQVELAKKIGVSVRTLQRWRDGKTPKDVDFPRVKAGVRGKLLLSAKQLMTLHAWLRDKGKTKHGRGVPRIIRVAVDDLRLWTNKGDAWMEKKYGAVRNGCHAIPRREEHRLRETFEKREKRKKAKVKQTSMTNGLIVAHALGQYVALAHFLKQDDNLSERILKLIQGDGANLASIQVDFVRVRFCVRLNTEVFRNEYFPGDTAGRLFSELERKLTAYLNRDADACRNWFDPVE